MGKSTISMAIFNSYVSLPECNFIMTHKAMCEQSSAKWDSSQTCQATEKILDAQRQESRDVCDMSARVFDVFWSWGI